MNALSFIVKTIAPRVKVIYELESPTCFDHDIKAVIIGNDFQTDDCGFMRHIVEKHNFADAYNYSMSLWSVLHELGHYFTGDDGYISDEEAVQYAICAMIPRKHADASPEIQNMYFDIESEYNATEWAINWIVSHPRLARIYNRLVK